MNMLGTLFATAIFMPHRMCLTGHVGLIWMEAISDLLVAAAYFSIPVALVILARKRSDIIYSWMVWLFAAFILACGMTHVFGALTLWVPTYWLDAWTKALTAVLSIATAALLWPIIPRIVAIPTHAQMAESEAKLRRAEKLSALGQLAGGIAHDINNILQSVCSGAGLIRRRAGDPETVIRISTLMEKAAERGTSVTRRLLVFARNDDMRAEPVRVTDLLDGMRDILVHALGPSVRVAVDIEPGVPPALADRGQLETSLLNLATNARDAMPSGGVVKLSAHNARLHDGPLKPGHYVRLRVTDSGCGMDAATLVRITEPFFTTKPNGRGTGLGLAIARSFAEQAGGSLTVQSTVGVGTVVEMLLPTADVAAETASVRAPAGAPVAATPGAASDQVRVLLVDDDDAVREIVADQLADQGFTVIQADSGCAALAMIDAGEPFDTMVSDLAMPGMDGEELIRAVHARRPTLRVLMLTGYAAVDVADRGVTVLRKPMAGAALAGHVRAVLTSEWPGACVDC